MKKYLFVIIVLAFCFPQFLDAENRRHFIILQDNSGSYWEKNNRLKINTIQDGIIALFNNEDKGDGYNLLSKEHSQNILFFDSNNDEITFLWFVADLAGNVNFYNNTNGEYQRFEEYFFTSGVNYSYKKSSKSAETFLKENFSERPKLNSIPYYKGTLNYYSFTSMAYPLCLDVIDADYSEEYIILIISDFKIGSTFGNKQDKSLFETAFKEKSDAVLKRVSFLKGQFVTVDFCDNYVGKGDGMIGYYAYKLRPNAGYPNPENIEVRINSNLIFDQTSFDSDQYSLRESEIVFQHNKDLSISEIGMELFLSSGEKVYKDISSVVQEENGHFKISKIENIVLPNIRNDSSNFDSEVRFVFKGNYSLGGEENASMKYVFDTRQSLNRTNFILKTKISKKQMSLFLISAFLLAVAVAAFILIKKGKPKGIQLKYNRFNDSYETIDFSPNGTGKVHTDYKYWSADDEQNGFEIKIEGRFEYANFNKFYNWKEKTGYPVRVYPRFKEVPGFSIDIYEENGTKHSSQEDTPIEIDGFNDGKFSFVYRFWKRTPDPITMPIKFGVGAYLSSTNNGLLSFELEKVMPQYEFHVGPDFGDVWLGVDPGTTGSCIAVGTRTSDLTMQKNKEGKDKITHSTIVIKEEGLDDGSEASIRKNVVFGDQANAMKDAKNKFLSIKKLLGYNEKFKIVGKKDRVSKEEFYEVESSFLSTLLIEGLLKEHYDFVNNNGNEFPQFLNNGVFAPQRAVFAIPNNFTAAKIQQLRDCIFNVEKLTLKEVRFIYEAEAIIVNYLNNPKVKEKETKQKSQTGENVFIFDMGGATINATLANVKRRKDRNDWIYEINIISKLGYGIGGDTIDYAYLKWIFSKSDTYEILNTKNPFVTDKEMMIERRGLKEEVLKLKKSTINNFNRVQSSKLIDRIDISTFNGYDLGLKDDEEGWIDPFEADIEKTKNSFLYSDYFEKLVWKNIRDIIGDILKICSVKSVHSIDTVIMSGRSSHFPRVKEIVETSIKKEFDPDIILLGLEESKSAVARGACYYGIQNNRIRLNNMTTNGAFGVIQTISQSEPSRFIQLIGDGEEFRNGVIHGVQRINECQDFTFDGKRVHFCQVMGVDPASIVSNAEKHKYTEIASIEAKPLKIQAVQIAITDKDKIQCGATDVNGDPQPKVPVEAVVCDSDIMSCNDEQYTFFVKQL